MLEAKIKLGKIKIPKVNFQDDLMVIGERIIIPDMQKGILRGRDIDGKAFPKNESNTVKRKGHSRVLVGEQRKLLSSFQRKRKGKFNVAITLKNQRKNIGRYLQEDGIRSNSLGRKHFKFFGITKLAEQLSIVFMKKQIEKAVKNAR